jgi:hypothetical protein
MNYVAILVCGIAAMVVGFIWFGPLFGKMWMQIMGVDTMSPEQREAMKKNMWGMYLIQFILSMITAGVLSVHIANWMNSPSALSVALCTWFGFILTTEASTALWSGKPSKTAWKMFLISASGQLVTFVVFAIILGYFM